MTVWRHNVVLMLICVTFFNVGYGRIIDTLNKQITTIMTPYSAETTVSTEKLIPSKYGAGRANITKLINKTTSDKLFKPDTTELPSNRAKRDFSGSKMLDLAFIMDTTGSMGSYIKSAKNNIEKLVDEIAVDSDIDLRVALIEYRDHPPEETSFVTRTNDFTTSVKEMREWLEKAKAGGGGDAPEAVAEGLFDVTKLSWRPEAAKIAVLVSDAPPHGLDPKKDSSFKDGSPKGNDPMKIVQGLAKREIILYAVGCEPSIDPYKDFFMALAYKTGGQYIPLSDPVSLIQAIIGGAREELSLQKFSKYVEQEIKRIIASGAVVHVESVARTVYEKLKKQGAKSQQLLRNLKPLDGASEMAKIFDASASMAEVRIAYERGFSALREGHHTRISASGLGTKDASKERGVIELKEIHPMTDIYADEHKPVYEDIPVYEHVLTHDDISVYEDIFAHVGIPDYEAKTDTDIVPDTDESYSTVDSAVSYDQIARLVRKKAAKLSPTV